MCRFRIAAVTAFAPADWLALLQAAPATRSVGNEPLLAGELEGYGVLLDAWQRGVQDDIADPARVALTTLARHVDERRPRQLRHLCMPGPWFEPLVDLPLPAFGTLPALPGLPAWMAVGFGFWHALLEYRQRVEAFCAPYQNLGTRTLARLEQTPDAPLLDSAAGLYAHWQQSQDQIESEIVRTPSWSLSLGQMTSAAAALRAAHRQYLELLLGVNLDGSGQRALSDEVADIRRQLRALRRIS
nr:E200 [uncultured bacterium]